MNIVTRIAPSPTGNLHIGTARTALFNFLFAKKHGGTFILRVEDTDTVRSTKEFEENILESLAWLGFTHDEFYRQSERTDTYSKYIQKMIDNGSAYVSNEKMEKSGDRATVIRFKNPNTTITFNDLVRGEISFDTSDLGDFVIAKSLEEPLYHLGVVVDDYLMKITHVIRGEDHISNTPRQILIQEAIGAPRPIYAHIPLILAPDRSKLSKRHGAVSITEYRNQGYLKDALINYLALLGWNPGDDREVFSLEDLIKEFSLEKVQKGGAIFDLVKLEWLNREHLKKIPDPQFEAIVEERLPERLSKHASYQSVIPKILPIIRDRTAKLSDIETMAEAGELDYFFDRPNFSKEALLPPEKFRPAPDMAPESLLPIVIDIIKELEPLTDTDWNAESIKQALWTYATERGRGLVLWPMRIALSGKEKSPDPFTLAAIFGKTETIERLQAAISLLRI